MSRAPPILRLRDPIQDWISRLRSSALTMDGAALGMASNSPSTQGSTSGLLATGYFCSTLATLAAASVACALAKQLSWQTFRKCADGCRWQHAPSHNAIRALNYMKVVCPLSAT